MATITLSKTGRIARVRFERPARLNALSPDLLRELIGFCEDLADDPSIRVVAFEGAGETFSAGADLPAFQLELEAAPETTADLGRRATEAIAALPQITAALIRRHCVGGAVVLAAACDIRICSDDTRFCIPELEAGLPLGWGGMAHLVRLVGESMAADLVLTCRPFSGPEALAAGFVSRVVPAASFDGEANSMLASIASKSRHVLTTTKRQLQSIRSSTFDPRHDARALAFSLVDAESSRILEAYTDRLR